MAAEKSFSEALAYHSEGRPGKIQIRPTKPTATQHDLSLAYTPGVAEPCREIAADALAAFRYTNRGNLVAVVTNGTAVLGLGNIGPLAGKPVMEGKAVLFKRFADIDVFDIELATEDPDEVIRTCELLEPTFGGINLEDIKAPECFIIEETLKERLQIPVFHDDQHGTAIIAGAGFVNACEITGRSPETSRVVINGAGAAGIACAHFFTLLGVNKENIMLCDSRGVCYRGRKEGMNSFKEAWAVDTDARTLEDALRGADAFVGVSVANVLTESMLTGMADAPVIFALANPDPEIPYPDACRIRPDAIVATGRSDFPNQVNNVLGFPFIFRGALDARARQITDSMKVAAARALAALAKRDVPDTVLRAYHLKELEFGREYIIPKPFDPRVLWHVTPAVVEAAMQDGVAREPIEDLDAYRDELRQRFQSTYGLVRSVATQARKRPQQVVFPQGADAKILRACRRVVDQAIARPTILGALADIEALAEELRISLDGVTVVDPHRRDVKHQRYAEELFRLRQRRGVTMVDAGRMVTDPNVFAAMMLRAGDADAVLGGLTAYYPATIRPALQLLPLEPNRTTVCAVYIAMLADKPYFFADCAVNMTPSAEQLVEIAVATAELARTLGIEPRCALLSYSNFGSADGEEARRLRDAVRLAHAEHPELALDGEMHADTAVVGSLLQERHPFSRLQLPANVLIFPNLSAANIAYKLLHRLGGAEVIGPVLSGLSRSVHVIQRDAAVSDIVNLTAIAALDALNKAATH